MQQQSVVRSYPSRSVVLICAQLLLWACVLLPSLGFAVGNPSTYPGCQTRAVTVAWGGTVPVNMSACHFFGLGTVRPGFFPVHGTASAGPQPVNIYNYQHNGSTPAGGGTDVFHVLDDNSDFIIVTVTIQPPSSPITVTPGSLPTLRAGESFSQTLSSSGGLAPYTYTLQSGALPLGLTRSGAVISGIPTQRGPYAFTVRSTDSTSPTAQFVDKGYSGNVLSLPISLVPASATAIQNVAISQPLNIVGGLPPHSCLLETGSFPAGISITSGCVITGTTSVAPGNFPVNIRVTDASTGPGNFFEVEPFTLTVSLPPSVSIAVAPASVNEDGVANLVYTVTRSLNLSSPTTVNISTSGTATSGTDYTGGVATVVIPASATTATITIDPTADSIVEPNETVILTVATGTGYTVAASPNNSATGTITNDDVSLPTVTLTKVSNAGVGVFGFSGGNGFASQTITTTTAGVGVTGATQTLLAAGLATTITETVPSGFALTGVTCTGLGSGGTATRAGNAVTLDAAAIAPGANIACTFTNTRLPTVTLTKVSNGGTGTFTFTGTNGWSSQNITTTSSGVGATGATQSLAAAATSTTITETVPSGFVLSGVTCTGLGSGGTATRSGNAVILDAAATAPGANIACTFTNTLTPQADLSITKTDGSATEVPGTPVTYTIVASNAGPDPVTGATVADTFPASITGVSWTCVGAGGGTCPASGSGNINASVNVPASGSVTFTATGTISAAATGTLANTATVSSAIADPMPGNNSATDSDTLTPQAEVSITKTDGQTSVGAGTNNTYTITASNAGPSNAPGSTVADTFPAVCTSVSWTCVGAGGGTCTASGTGNINDSVNLPSGGSVVYTAVCAISSGATGTLSNTATVAVAGGITDPTPGNNSATDSSTINDFPTLTISDVSIDEGNTGTQTLNFTVTRTGTTASSVGFSFATADGTATAGSDYVAATGTGTIPSGGATGTTQVSVTINGDAVFENSETFFVNLSAPTNAAISDAQGQGTITNDDTAPTLAINDVSITEGNSGPQSLVFTVMRTGLTALPATFTATTADGTASAPSDYLSALTGTTSIAAGGATGTTTLTATINGDNVVEATENFFVNLTLPGNATIGDALGLGTITNDDTAGVTVTQSGGSTTVTEGGATDTYTLVLTSQPTANVNVSLNAGTQLSAATSPVVFTSANWNVAQTVTVSAVDDAIAEGPHNGSVTHTVTSSNATYQGLLVDSVSAMITDNDSPGVSIVQSGGNTAVTEGGAADSYTVVLTSQPSSDVTVTPSGTQVSASPTSLTFTNANWNMAQTVTVTALDDNVVEGPHTGSITHAVTSADSNYNNLSIAGVPNISITDNDTATVQFAPTSVSQSETTSPMAFTVTLSNPVASGVTVTVNSANGTATAGSDYTAVAAQTVSFAANSTTAQTVNVMVSNDALDEDNETYSLTLSNLVATGTVTLGSATATGTIQDDDALPVLSVANVSQPEGNAGTSTMSFVVNLTPVSGRAVSFTRATADGTATVANNDYAALAAGPITIPAGQTNVSIPVTINGDTVFEGNESFSLNLTAVSNATPGTLSATGTLEDDDQQPTTTEITSDEPDPSAVNAPYTVQFTVRGQSSAPAGTVTVNDGTGASCGPVTLVAGTPPASSGSCVITSITPGTKTLTATYVPASTAFGASNDTELHTVVVVAPAIAYSPTTGTTVAFTGVTTIGTTGNGTIAATPSGGAGTGAGATTTINTCTLGGASPAAFAGAAAINLSFVGNTTTPQNLALTCTSQQTAQTATLTCNETRGTDAPVQRQWPLNCPAGTPVAPTITYAPTTGTAVAFTGVTTIGTTGNGTIAATPSSGIGTGAPATTTINTCTLGGTNPGSFAGAAAINLSFVGNTTTPQNLALTCTSQQTAQTATLTCNETRGAAAPVQRQWPLSCPAGPLLQLTATPAIGGTANVTGTAGGSTTTTPITLTNPNPIAVSLTCTAPAFPFTATPVVFSIPAGGNTPVTIGISPTLPGNYTGTLSCTIAGSPQVLTFNLAGTLVPAIAVGAMADWSRWLLVLLMLFGGLALGYSRRH